MAEDQRVRVVAWIDARQLAQYGELAREMGVSRSSLLRRALAGMLSEFRAEAAALRAEREKEEAASASLAPPLPKRRGRPRAARPPESRDAHDRLASYAAALEKSSPHLDADAFDLMLRTQAAVLGVPSAGVDDLVSSVQAARARAAVPAIPRTRSRASSTSASASLSGASSRPGSGADPASGAPDEFD